MKTSITLTGSLVEMSQVLALLADHGFGEESLEATLKTNSTESTVNWSPVQGMPDPTKMVEVTPMAEPVTVSGVIDPVTIELDASGLPWDERIHASTKTKKADGTWTARRGVDKATSQAVEAELRAKFPNAPARAVTPTAPVASAPTVSGVAAVSPVSESVMPTGTFTGPGVMAPTVVPAGMPGIAPIMPVAAPVAPEPVAVAPVAPVAPASSPTTLHELMERLAPMMDPAQGGQITPEYLTGIVNEVNTAWTPHLGGAQITSIADIAAHPNLQIVPYIWQLFQRDGKAA